MAPSVTLLDRAWTPISALGQLTHLSHLALLHSAAPDHPLSRYSYLAADPVARISATAEGWSDAVTMMRQTTGRGPHHETRHRAVFGGGWIGWLGYELGHALLELPRHRAPNEDVADLSFGLYDWVIRWDHHTDECALVSTGIDARGVPDAQRAQERRDFVLRALERPVGAPARSYHVTMNADLSATAYQEMVAATIEAVLNGDIFQANISQRFTAPFRGDPVELYRRVVAITAAPMAALLQHGSVSVISASPELFLSVSPDGVVETRPIKGTRPRGGDAGTDRRLAEELQASAKDRAENVMIVDLMRNDLARVCSPGSVRVEALCTVESHPTVHHLVSTVVGTLRPECDALDLIGAAFPGGSVTGAPKRRALEVIQDLEPVGRGVYTGAIGWIGLDGAMQTNLAIRTITLAGGVASLHAGGGITARSEPVAEHAETLDKARALIAALGGTA
ncbi:MAG TPA: aminodeoxychorismate synthase component I [Gemmatimonadales bacterium]